MENEAKSEAWGFVDEGAAWDAALQLGWALVQRANPGLSTALMDFWRVGIIVCKEAGIKRDDRIPVALAECARAQHMQYLANLELASLLEGPDTDTVAKLKAALGILPHESSGQ